MQKDTENFLKKVEEKIGKNWKSCVDVAYIFVEGGFAEEDKQLALNHCLMKAVNQNNHYLVKYFAIQGADVNAIERKRIFQISKNDNDKIEATLVTKRPALNIAVQNRNEKIVQCLIEMGATPNDDCFRIIAEKREKLWQEEDQEMLLPLTASNLHKNSNPSRIHRAILHSKNIKTEEMDIRSLDNIELLLREPEKYRKHHAMFSVFDEQQLNTITATEKHYAQECEKEEEDKFLKEKNELLKNNLNSDDINSVEVEKDLEIRSVSDSGFAEVELSSESKKIQSSEINTSYNLETKNSDQETQVKNNETPKIHVAGNVAKRLRDLVSEYEIPSHR